MLLIHLLDSVCAFSMAPKPLLSWLFLLLVASEAFAEPPIRIVSYPKEKEIPESAPTFLDWKEDTVIKQNIVDDTHPTATVHRDFLNKNEIVVRVSEPSLRQGWFLKQQDSLVEDIILIPADFITEKTRQRLLKGMTRRPFERLKLQIVVKDGISGLVSGIGPRFYTPLEKQIYDTVVEISSFTMENMQSFERFGETYEVILHMLQGRLIKRSCYYLIPNFSIRRASKEDPKFELATILSNAPYDELRNRTWSQFMYSHIPYFMRMLEHQKREYLIERQSHTKRFHRKESFTKKVSVAEDKKAQYYALLGIIMGEEDKWTSAFRKQALLYHPDRKGEKGEVMMKQLNEAKEYFEQFFPKSNKK